MDDRPGIAYSALMEHLWPSNIYIHTRLSTRSMFHLRLSFCGQGANFPGGTNSSDYTYWSWNSCHMLSEGGVSSVPHRSQDTSIYTIDIYNKQPKNKHNKKIRWYMLRVPFSVFLSWLSCSEGNEVLLRSSRLPIWKQLAFRASCLHVHSIWSTNFRNTNLLKMEGGSHGRLSSVGRASA